MDFDKININELKPADYNPRKMQDTELEKLNKNLNKFGLVDPIIINLKNMHIIGGHQRYKVLKQNNPNQTLNIIKLGGIAWVFNETNINIEDEHQEKALNIALNRISGEFDENKLNELFIELQNNDFDVDLTGFNDYEVLDIDLNNIDMEVYEDTPETNADIDINNDDEYTANIPLYTETQKQVLTDTITRLKKEQPDKTIGTLINEYIEKNIEDEKKTAPYTIIFDSKKDYDKYIELTQKINTTYKQDALLNLIQDHDNKQ